MNIEICEAWADAEDGDRHRLSYDAMVRAYVEHYGDQMSATYRRDASTRETEAPKNATAQTQGHARFVAYGDQTPAGCVTLVANMDTLQAEIRYLYVERAARGFGIGRRLMDHALTHARALGIKTVDLTTAKSLHPAQRLYRSMGFEEVAAAPDAACQAPVSFRLPLAPPRDAPAPVDP